jgi:hypothetical protein
MKGRRLALLLLAYLTLDLGNPLMPGVVHFAGGRLDVVEAGRPRGADVPAPAVVVGVALPFWTGPEPSRVPRLTALVAQSRPWIPRARIPARRALPSAAHPVASPDDH